MTETITEERVVALEKEVARLRAKVDGFPTKTNPYFLETMTGIYADNPEFEEMTKKIEADREKERIKERKLLAEDLKKIEP
jgi:hypothetical protein